MSTERDTYMGDDQDYAHKRSLRTSEAASHNVPSVKRLICKAIGHRLETAVHARRPTLWCGRCKRIEWWWSDEHRLILPSDVTADDLERLGARSE